MAEGILVQLAWRSHVPLTQRGLCDDAWIIGSAAGPVGFPQSVDLTSGSESSFPSDAAVCGLSSDSSPWDVSDSSSIDEDERADRVFNDPRTSWDAYIRQLR